MGCRLFDSFPANGSPRGVILISADTLGAGHVGCYGYQRDTTPNIDLWAENAILFEGAYAPLPGTLPSHMSMMTGLYPKEHGVYPSREHFVALAPQVKTLAERLQQSGFHTAGFTEGGYVARCYGFNRGFDEFEDRFASWHNVLRSATQFLHSVGKDDSFFLFLHTYQVHDPYRPPPGFSDLFARQDIPLPFAPKGSNLARVNRGELTVTPEEVALFRSLHDAEIRFFDHRFPEIRETLQQTGLGERTLVILTADHGEEFMEHGRLVHEQVYEPTVRIPLVIDVPAWSGRHHVPELVELVDLPRTILTWAGIACEQGLGGKDLLALAAGEKETTESRAYCESFLGPEKALVARRENRELKLIVDGPFSPGGVVSSLAHRSILLATGDAARFRIRSDIGPTEVEVYSGSGPTQTWLVNSEWQQHDLDIGTSSGEVIPFFLAVKSPEPPGSSIRDALSIELLDDTTRLFSKVRLFDLEADREETVDISEVEARFVILLSRELIRRLDEQQLVAAPIPIAIPDLQRARLQALGYLAPTSHSPSAVEAGMPVSTALR